MSTPLSPGHGEDKPEGILDALTGLPDQDSLLAHLSEALDRIGDSRKKIAVLFLDVDGFTQATRDLAREEGNVLLRILADRLKHCIREHDFAARFKEDEFVVVLEQVAQGKDIIDVAQRIQSSMAEPMTRRGGDRLPPLVLGASIGIAVYPDHGLDAASLLANAQAAMADVKRSGKNDFMYFGSG